MNGTLHEELKTLLGEQQGPCLSLFMPTFRTGTESQQNQIRLKNLLRGAEEKVLAAGLRPQEVKEFLEPALTLTTNVLFWRRQSDGLALFRSRDRFRTFTLPEVFDEALTVGERFHVRPLLPLLQEDRRFYILALSQKELRLLEGTCQNVREIEIESVPKSLAEALQYDESEKQVRFRTGSPGGGGMAMVSGHGGVAEDAKDNLLKYFRMIDRALHELIEDEQAPLVLAGVDYLFPIYREVNTFPRLIEGGIAGNPKGVSAEALHRSALKIVTPLFQRAENDAVALYRQSSGTGLTSADIGEIVPASVHGRVGSLFVAVGRQRWGKFNPETGTAALHRQAEEGSEDLLEIAAIQTFLNGGSVFILSPERMPDASDLIAVFRY
ncbi:MAG: hypothetical protein LLG93_16730 [Deltaproteobacteria bacterium]|nr:hypothetical protein [Deltaproteobacteria bacterium]